MGFFSKVFKKVKSSVSGLFKKSTYMDLLTMGGYSANQQAQDAADYAKKQYRRETQAAAQAAQAIADEEEERKRRLAMLGSQAPGTLLTSYLGVTTPANVGKTRLG